MTPFYNHDARVPEQFIDIRCLALRENRWIFEFYRRNKHIAIREHGAYLLEIGRYEIAKRVRKKCRGVLRRKRKSLMKDLEG